MDTHFEAVRLAQRPYLIMTAVDSTTEGHPITFARVLEIEGCFGQGGTREAAIKDLRLAMVDYIESLLIDGLPVPEPTRLSPTFGTATQRSFTYVREGKRLEPKMVETNREAYILSPHVH